MEEIVFKTENPKNTRQSLVTLTSTGKELINDASITVEQGCNSIYSLLNETEVDQLIGLLNKIKC